MEDKRAGDTEQLLAHIQDLDEGARKDLMTTLMKSVFHAPAKKVAFAEAMKSASDETEQILVTEAVENASTLEARKAIVVKAVRTAQDNQAEKEIIAEAVSNTSNVESRKAAVANAVQTAQNDKQGEVVAEAIENTSTLEAKKTAAAKAVESADNGGKLEVVIEAANAVNEPATQEQMLAQLRTKVEALPKMLGQMIAWSSVIIMVVVLLTVFMAGLGQLSNVEGLVTIAIAVVSTLAGYCFGAASLLSKRLPEFRTLLRKGLG